MKKIPVFALMLVAMLAAPRHAYAQWVVFDPSNFVENTLTELHTLTQIENQLVELQNQAQMLLNQGENLRNLNFTALSRLQATFAATQQLLNEAQGMTLNLATTQEQFAQHYPAGYSTSVSQSHLNADSEARWSDSLAALDTATQVQAQANANLPSDESILTDVLTKSSSAVGALQAIQATNELLGLRVRQVMQSQQLSISEDRASALEQARIVEAEARARAIRSQFMTSSTPYKPESVDLSGQ